MYLISTHPDKVEPIQKMLREPCGFVISTQVINEFIHVCHRKKLLSSEEIAATVEEFLRFFELVVIEASTIRMAMDLKQRYFYSWYDSLILAAAFQSGCSRLYSEDLNHHQMIEGSLLIRNPFIE